MKTVDTPNRQTTSGDSGPTVRFPHVARVSSKSEYFTSLFAEQWTDHFLKTPNTQRIIKRLYQHVNRRSRECFADNVLNHQNFKWSLVQRFPQQTSTDTRPTVFWLRGSFSASSSDINTSRLLQLFNYYQLGPARPGSARPGPPPPLLIGPIWEKDCRLNLFHAASGPWLGEIGWDPAEDEGGGGGGGDGASNRWRCRERERGF